MKLVKFAPAIAATLVLAACTTPNKIATATTDAMKATGNAVAGAATATTDAVKGAATATKDAVKGAKVSVKPELQTAAYLCDVKGKRKVVSATYAFLNGKADLVTLSIDGKVVGDLKFDEKYEDGSRFVAGNRVWSLDSGFAPNTVSKTVPVQYRSNNNIVAKNCEIAK
ncbi:MAG: Holliday junction resolvase [Pasteurellaceae bacterium]|nr:Holliday junction resolvase [Pasteurellaceae bacterium]